MSPSNDEIIEKVEVTMPDNDISPILEYHFIWKQDLKNILIRSCMN